MRNKFISNVVIGTAAAAFTFVVPMPANPAFAANGCGAEGGVSSVLVPNGIPGIYDFTQACNNHDDCYGNVGFGKDLCDTTFRRDMLDSCNGGPVCGVFAEVYAAAVRNFGLDAYGEAQSQALHNFAVAELARSMQQDGMITQQQANEILQSHGLPQNAEPDPVYNWFDDYDEYSNDVANFDDYGTTDDGDSGLGINSYDEFGGVDDSYETFADYDFSYGYGDWSAGG